MDNFAVETVSSSTGQDNDVDAEIVNLREDDMSTVSAGFRVVGLITIDR